MLTGQNNVSDMVTDFGIRNSNLVELKSFRGVSLSLATGLKRTPALISEIRSQLDRMDVKCAVFHGDTTTTFAAAIAAKRSKREAAHIEAGLRSGSVLEPVPEEFFRRVADGRASILFAPSREALENLRREGKQGKSVLVGNTICDVLNQVSKRVTSTSYNERFVLVTSHRYENIFIKSRLKRILQIIDACRLPVYWPLHTMTEAQLRRFGLLEQLREMSNVHILPTLSYVDFVGMLTKSAYVITDGGGIEEESLILGKPCLLLRRRTERGEGLRIGLTFLSKLDLRYSRQIIDKLDSGNLPTPTMHNPYLFENSPTELIGTFLHRRFG